MKHAVNSPGSWCCRVMLLGAFFLGSGGLARADVSLSAWIAHSPDDISGFTTLSGNDAVATVTLPFPVVIEGVSYNSVAISTNGWIEFGGNTCTSGCGANNSDPANACLPTSKHTNPFLAAYWDDMQTFGTHIRYGTVGTSPNRTFVIDFELDDTSQEVFLGGSRDDIRLQIQIHERGANGGSQVINVQYRNSGDLVNGQGATIGFQGAGGASARVQPITCNGKVLDDNRPDEGWSVDVPRSGAVTMHAIMAHSPDDISGFTTLSGNDAVATVSLPFPVRVEDLTYSTLAISTNGWIEFGGNTCTSGCGTANSDPANACLPTSKHTNPFLAAYWDDLQTFGSNVRYGTVGASPNRTFIIDYEVDVDPAVESNAADDIRWQIQIHEGAINGGAQLVNVKYRDSGSLANGQGATIGFQGAGGSLAIAQPLTCNGKVLDDNRPNEGWSIDVTPPLSTRCIRCSRTAPMTSPALRRSVGTMR